MPDRPPSSINAAPDGTTPASGVLRPKSSASGSASGSGSAGPAGTGARASGKGRGGQYLALFWLSGKLYALDVGYVGEVVSFPAITPVPLTPPAVLGMCNLRGTALAIVNLAAVLELPQAGETESSSAVHVLVIRSSTMLAGARIDSAEAVYRFDRVNFQARSEGEHPAVQGLLQLKLREANAIATLLNGDELVARLEGLQFKRQETENK